jgi:hypothetical protein
MFNLSRFSLAFRITLAVGTFLAVASAGVVLGRALAHRVGLGRQPLRIGATFSVPYAQSLGIDWRGSYLSALDDLHVKRLRIPVYWTMVQATGPDDWDWSDIDWQLREAERRGVEVILAVGRKLPRWPECHVPDWAGRLPEEEQRVRLLNFVRRAVQRYAASSSVVAWQVENEPLFPFGLCPAPDRAFLEAEVAVVRSVDYRPVVITESGELSTWFGAAAIADVLGVSTYRVVWNSLVGYFHWPIPPQTYFQKALAVSPFVDGVFISELQAEPWAVGGITAMPMDRQRELMNPAQLRDNVEYARDTGAGEVYLWGVEWWYYAREHGYDDVWTAGRNIIRQENALFGGAIIAL